jgi:hypothetical protein
VKSPVVRSRWRGGPYRVFGGSGGGALVDRKLGFSDSYVRRDSIIALARTTVMRNVNIWVTLLAILTSTVRFGSAQSPPDSNAAINLRTFGWQPPERGKIDVSSIAIDHKNRVLVGFTVEERGGLVDRNRPSLGFRIVRFSSDGKADLSLSLPTNKGGRTGVYLSDSDQIVVRANDSFQLLQAGEGSIKNPIWKILAPCAMQCCAAQSDTHHTLILYTVQADPVNLIRFLPEPVLERCGKEPSLMKSNEDMIQNWPEIITDRYVYHHGDGPDSGPYRWPLCDYEHRTELPLRIGATWTVLSDDLFLVRTHSHQTGNWGVEVVTADGHVKFRAALLKHESAGTDRPRTQSSERGDRIAVDVLTIRGRNQTLDIAGHVTSRRIAVYDVAAGKEIASIRTGVRYRYRFAFDLSPDGRRLAILEDDVVRIVDLDEPTKSDGR